MATRLLLVISSEPDGPSVRHRWRAFAGDLERAGVVLQVAPWPKERAGRQATLVRAAGADGVVLARRLLPRPWALRLRQRARRLLYDIDDAMPLRDSQRGATRSWTRARRFDRLVALADQVMVGNAHLASLCRAPRRPPLRVPTTVEVGAAPAPLPPRGPLVVGWIGARATLPYLEAGLPALGAVARAGRALRLRVVADAAPREAQGVEVEWVPWSEAGEAAALAGMHAGFAPLPDDAWTRGKCGFKVLQMMGAGRPVVASPVGVQAEQVQHGESGFLAASTAEQVDALLRLADDPAACERMGRAAHERVRAQWSRAAWAPRLVQALEAWLA
ncbi:MAG: glycosyltransferase [Planctomycetia bacterium]